LIQTANLSEFVSGSTWEWLLAVSMSTIARDPAFSGSVVMSGKCEQRTKAWFNWVESCSSSIIILFERDLRANASGVCREGKSVPTFPDHALMQAAEGFSFKPDDRAPDDPMFTRANVYGGGLNLLS
jgi:hypothetical protein